MRYGTGVDFTRHNVINNISINTLDNQRRIIGKLNFSHCIPMSIGSLSLMSGESEELTFPVSFTYEHFSLVLSFIVGHI